MLCSYYNNGESNNSNSGICINDGSLQRVGLFISDNFDQPSYETIDLTQNDYSSCENLPSHLVNTKIVPVRTFMAPQTASVLPNGFSSIQIISNNNISHELIKRNVNPSGAQRSVFVTSDKVQMLARKKCVLQPEERQKATDNDEYHAVIVHEPEPKIPRPPNAFMIFANEWRKKVAHKFNNESNKDISVRLGQMWRNLDKNRKEEYFVMARKADAEHKIKYPDYVYNPKEARLRKALRDSWKDKGRRSANGQIRSSTGGKSPINWSSTPISQNRTLLPMPSLSNMTFSMAADGYSIMETPAWSSSWYPYRHNPVPYIVPQFPDSFTGDGIGCYPDRMYHQPLNIQQTGVNGVRSSVIGPSRSPFTNSEPDTSKGPLSQLQELANVFSSPNPCTRSVDSDINVKVVSPAEPPAEAKPPSANTNKLEVESTVLNNDSDSGYVTDHPQQQDGGAEAELNKSKAGVSDVLMTETNGGESFMESLESNGQSSYIGMDDVFLDCNFLSNENFGGSNTSLDMADNGKNALPGFQQAFGSTEIGRFSRNDFFTNPPPETPEKSVEPNPEPEPQENLWNPVPTQPNFPSAPADVDYFSDLCDIEESLLHPYPMLNGSPLASTEDTQMQPEESGQENVEPTITTDQLEALLDIFSDEIDHIDVDELLQTESDKLVQYR